MNDDFERYEIENCIRHARANRNRVLGSLIADAVARLKRDLLALVTRAGGHAAPPHHNGPTAHA